MEKNKKAEPENSGVGLEKDELGKTILVEQEKQMLEEKRVFENNIADIQKAKKNFEDQWKIDKRLYEIILNDFGLIKPVHKYQLSEEYWKLQLEKFKYQVRQDTFMAQAKLNDFDKQTAVLQEQLDSAINTLDDIHKRLEGIENE